MQSIVVVYCGGSTMSIRWIPTALAASLVTLSSVSIWPVIGQSANPLDVLVRATPPADEFDPGGFPIDFFDAYSWQIFIALNWPAAAGQRGIPDMSKTIADRTSPRVWETWKSVEETFLPTGAAPADWDVPETASTCNNAGALGASPVAPMKILADFNQGDDNGGGIGPLVAQNGTYVRYEIRMNKVEFGEIAARKLYLRANLPLDDTSPLLTFPSGTIDVKAAWRELKDGECRPLLSAGCACSRSGDRYLRPTSLRSDRTSYRAKDAEATAVDLVNLRACRQSRGRSRSSGWDKADVERPGKTTNTRPSACRDQ